jgi:hypothetical protein
MSEMLFVFICSVFAYVWNIWSVWKLIQYRLIICFDYIVTGTVVCDVCLFATSFLFRNEVWVGCVISLVCEHVWWYIREFTHFEISCTHVNSLLRWAHLWGITDLYPVCSTSSVTGWMLGHTTPLPQKIITVHVVFVQEFTVLLHMPFYCIDKLVKIFMDIVLYWCERALHSSEIY